MKKGEEKKANDTVVVGGEASFVDYAHVGLFDVTFKDGSQRKKVSREEIRFPNMHSTEDVSYCENWTRANEAVILQRRRVKRKNSKESRTQRRTMADQYMLRNGTFGETKEGKRALERCCPV